MNDCVRRTSIPLGVSVEGDKKKKNRKEEIGNKGILRIPSASMKQHLDNRNRMPRSDGP